MGSSRRPPSGRHSPPRRGASRSEPRSAKRSTTVHTRGGYSPRQAASQKRNVRNAVRKPDLTTRFLGVLLSALIAVLTFFNNIITRAAEFVRSLNRRGKAALISGGVILIGMIVLLIIFIVVSRPNSYVVYLNSDLVGIVKMNHNKGLDDAFKENKADAYIVELVVYKLTQDLSETVKFYDTVKVEKDNAKTFVTMDFLISEIIKKAAYRVQAAVIMVNDTAKVTVRNIEEANRILDAIKDQYISNIEGQRLIDSRFTDTVTTVLNFVDTTGISSAAQANAVLTAAERISGVHTVKPGETTSEIRRFYDMSLEYIKELNPGLDPDKLVPGQVLNITHLKPFLSVITVHEVRTEEVVKFTTQVHNDDTQPKSYSKVTQAGKDGLNAVYEHITRENARTVSREVVNTEVIEPPITEIVVKGTK